MKMKETQDVEGPLGIEASVIEDHKGAAYPGSPYKTLVLQSVRRIMRAVEIYSRKLATRYQVTGPQLACLLAIVDLGPVTATGIAREVHLSTSTVVGILTRLEEKGLIVRHRSERDRRQIHIMPSPKGHQLAEHAPSPLQDTLAQALKELSELEQATIAFSLQRIVEMMEAPDGGTSSLFEVPDHLEEEAGPMDPQGGKQDF